MGRLTGALLSLVLLGGCAPSTDAAPLRPERAFLQVNLAGGFADGAELRGRDDVVTSLLARVEALPLAPVAIFLNEACESHAEHAAAGLGSSWRWFFVPSWPGRSDCFPAGGRSDGRFGNAVLVRDPAATHTVVPSCEDTRSVAGRCLPNWAPPAEQRRGVCGWTAALVLCSFHLDSSEWEWHDEQLRAVGRFASSVDLGGRTLVIGGDMNAGPEAVEDAFGPEALDLTVATFPAGRPSRRIDHVIVAGAGHVAGRARAVDLGRCAATFRPDGRCSDHRGLLAEVGPRQQGAEEGGRRSASHGSSVPQGRRSERILLPALE